MNGQILHENTSFKEFIWGNFKNRRIIKLTSIAILIQLVVFKYFYPYPSFIHDDSFVYLETAYKNFGINSYLVGYSRFLRLFSVFTSSDTALVVFQYLLIQCSSLFFLFTIFYFHSPSKIVQIILLCFMVLNPLFLFLANLISSDGFFLAISLIWFGLLVWIINKPSRNILVWHAVILFIAFTVRYNALIYPIITILAFLKSSMNVRQKIFGLGTAFFCCLMFVTYTTLKYKTISGYWQYAPFSGWQLSNNAMYAYRYVDSANRKPVPNEFKRLDESIRKYFDSTRNVLRFPKENLQASTFYMWDRSLPLYHYRNMVFAKDSISTDFQKWAMMGPLYKSYGLYIIKQYPDYFARYFLWPNANKYYAPPVEYLQKYNAGIDSAVPLTAEWFGYYKVHSRVKGYKTRLLDFYPIISGMMNLVFLASLIAYFLLKGYGFNSRFYKMILLTGTFWIVNAAFSIFSTASALRFLAFPILLMTISSLTLIDYLCKIAIKTDVNKALKPDSRRIETGTIQF
ncbi:hypothetical protein A4D02_09320 [Niastella koreensis]|uniref:Protoporphyrinogen oxidase-like protein n=2 Tax=Niastella koreensis TaxID=354356 RepID=G8TLX5_NIAKG|nr:hypothetical protein [Niastella koreensis]AEV98735.1 protoporphyrinogen oxidase-like protein [Niastella koreensis GR20-10]OQP44973.1 hypothetical protein A4D02_09320 [Niastella koreensis]